MKERIDNIINDQEEAFSIRRRNTICFNVEQFDSKDVQRMQEELKKRKLLKRKKKEKKNKRKKNS